MNKQYQALLRPEVAAKYVVTQEPGRIVVRSLGYREIDLRTLTVEAIDELVSRPGGFEYFRLKRKRRSKATGAPQ